MVLSKYCHTVVALAVLACTAGSVAAQRPQNPTGLSSPRGPSGRGESDGPRPRLFGFALECEDCESVGLRGRPSNGPFAVWHYSAYPRVFAVATNGAAARAGIKVNDLVVAIDGQSLLTSNGATRFGAVRAGDRVRLTIERDHKNMDVSLVLGPSGPFAFGPGRGARGVLEDSLSYVGHAGTTRVEVTGPASVDATTDSTGVLVLHIAGNVVTIRPESTSPGLDKKEAKKRKKTGQSGP